nr:hypothetical protein [Methanosarcina horonobensis]
MLIQYIQAALERAKYEIIDDEEPYYGEVPELEGVWLQARPLKNAAETWKKLSMNGLSSD